MAWATKITTWLLSKYPADFRREHAEEVFEFIDAERDGGRNATGSGRFVFWCRIWWDLACGAVRLRRVKEIHVSEGGHRPSGRATRGHVFGSLMSDLRWAVRSLAASPVSTVVVILTLALGVGLNTAIFSVVNAVLLRPFDYRSPDELFVIDARLVADDLGTRVSGGAFREIREKVAGLRDVAAITSIRQNLTGVEGAEQVEVGWVSTNFFPMLGVRAWKGRLFQDSDPPGTAAISYATWRGAFGADPEIVGRTMQLDGRTYTVVGVLPPGFKAYLPRTPADIQVWKVPDDWWQNGDVWGEQGPEFGLLVLVGRIREQTAAGLQRVQTQLAAIAAELRLRYEEYASGELEFSAAPLGASVVRQVRPTLLLLFGAVILVLLIACANVTNLLLVRARARRREVALRVALGAGQGRILRLFLVESLALALVGGTIGATLGVAATQWLARLRPHGVPRIDDLSPDTAVFVFALALSLACTVLVGLAPAWGAARRGIADGIREGAGAPGRDHHRVNGGLAVMQLAMSLVLLIGAGLLTASLARLQRVEPGFDYDGVLLFSVSLPGARYDWPGATNRFLLEMERRIEALPGVTSAGVVWPAPLTGSRWGSYYGTETIPEDGRAFAEYRLVTPDYFETVTIPLLEGRGFGDADAKRSVVVSRNLAERAWPGRSAVGREVTASPWGPEASFEVIGVVENVQYAGLTEPPEEVIYFDAAGWSWSDWEVDVAVRAAGDLGSLVAPVRRAIASLDSEIPMAEVRPWREYVNDRLATNRFALLLIGLFAVVAAALAALGLYGVLSYSVSRRTKEIGIRIALGSEQRQILALVLTQGFRLIVAGVVIGVAGALALTRFLSAFLYGVTPTDPTTFAAIAASLAVVGLAACYLPARRATRMDPVRVLKAD